MKKFMPVLLMVILAIMLASCSDGSIETTKSVDTVVTEVVTTEEVTEPITEAESSEEITEVQSTAKFYVYAENGDTVDQKEIPVGSNLGEYLRTLKEIVYSDSEWGIYITAYGELKSNDEEQLWLNLLVDGVSSMVGADQITVEEGHEYALKLSRGW